MTTSSVQTIRVGHSPDADDAFMFYGLAKDCFATDGYQFVHELVDIETLNRRAFQSELELTALSCHAYAYLHDRYKICSCGASMGDNYGPMIVAKQKLSRDDLAGATIAVPGTLTTAYLAAKLWLPNFKPIVAPFDQMLDIVERGEFQGQVIDAGLVIHEGQLTYGDQNLSLVVDLGQWWMGETNLPLPLGCNGIRKDLGETTIREVNHLLYQSIKHGLDHRKSALDYALSWGRGLDRSDADRFVGMYVNDWTLDFGERGREAVRLLLRRGFEAGIIPTLVEPEFVEPPSLA
jgi:1,4-dihydroxy-6-naphthoate synthase